MMYTKCMNNIYKPITLTWWQVGILKIALLSAGILVATYWPKVMEWTNVWWILFVITALYTLSLRFKNR